MRPQSRAWALVATAAAVLLLAPPPAARERSALTSLPALTLWAWERPEDLRGVGRDTAVAFLAQTITIAGDGERVSPRRQPLRVSPHTPVIAVTRIEAPRARWIGSGPGQADRVARAIAATASAGVAAIQIDFDATVSQRAFYRDLLHRVRSLTASRVPLSITALASWCMDDDWIRGLPIDEAVAMLFRMGPDTGRLQRSAAAGSLRLPACRSAVGVSLDEPIGLPRNRDRVYVFNPAPWSDAALASARRLQAP
jgi:hypothetical protein